MRTYNLIRSTLAATICLSVLAACDGRGVTAMKSRMYTAEERAQAKLLAQQNGGSTTVKTDKSNPAVAATPAASPALTEPQIDPVDHAEMKNYFEPSKTDASGTQATVKLAVLKQIVESQLGVENDAAKARVLGITIDNASKGGKSIINLRAVVNFREREQFLHLDNLVIDTTAKDIVSGTSNVVLKFKSPTVDDKVETVTTKDLVVASVCLEAKGAACAHAYLILQFSRKDNLVDVAVFELDENMAIVNSNIGDWTKKTYEIAEVQVEGAAPAPQATLETARRHQNIDLMNQTMGINNPFAKVEAPAKPASATATPVKPAAATVTPAPAAPPAPAKPAPAKPAATTPAAPAAPAAKPAATTPAKPAAAPVKADVAPAAKQMTRDMLGVPNDPFASVGSAKPAAPAATPKAAAPAEIPTGTPFRGAKMTWNWLKSWF